MKIACGWTAERKGHYLELTPPEGPAIYARFHWNGTFAVIFATRPFSTRTNRIIDPLTLPADVCADAWDLIHVGETEDKS